MLVTHKMLIQNIMLVFISNEKFKKLSGHDFTDLRSKYPDFDIEPISQEQQRISKKAERTFVLL